MKAVAIMHVVSTCMYISIGGVLMNVDWMGGVLFYVIFTPWFIATFFWIKMLVHPSKEHRAGLTWAVWLAFATVVLGSIA